MAKRAARAAAGETKTYALELKNGDTRRITIPSDWKLTFGQLVPHTLRDTNGRSSMVALRIYGKSKEDLRAVMTDVVAFRDMSFDLLEKRTKVQRQTAQKRTPQGMKDVIVEAAVSEWVNPDADDVDDVPGEFLRLGSKKPDEDDIGF